MRLEKNIYQLLFQYDCVIVPRLGAFVTYPTHSTINVEENIINPPSKVINFSSNIKKDDHLLRDTYASNENVDIEQATSLLTKDVNNWYTILEEGKPIIIDKVGVLSQSTDGVINFEPHSTVNFLAFGLKPLKPNLILPQTTKELVKEENRSWSSLLAVASIIPIIIGGYFYFNTPQPVQKFVDHQWSGIVLPVIKETVPNLINTDKQEQKIETQKESIHNLPATIINPLEIIQTKNNNQEIGDSLNKNVISKYEITVVEEKQLNENEKEVKAIIKNTKINTEDIKATTNKEVKPEIVNKIETNPKKYQIIAASLRRQEDANRMLEFLEKEGYKNSSIVYVKGHYYYVTFDGFNDKEQATKYLNNLHKQRPDAWIREHR